MLRRTYVRVSVFLLALAVAFTLSAAAQTDSARQPITPDDYGKWESLGYSTTMSLDGQWMVYQIRRVNEENELRVAELSGDTTFVVPHGSNASFSKDGRWLAYSIGVGPKERRRLEKQSKPIRSELGLRNLESGDTLVIEDVASFAFSDDGTHIAMRRYAPNNNGDRDHDGVDLVVRNLTTEIETNFGNVSSFVWQDEGPLLAMIIDAESQAGNGVQLYDPPSGRLRTLESYEARYTNLTWRDEEDDLAVLRVRGDDEQYEDSTHVVLVWRHLEERRLSTLTFDPDSTEGFPADTRIVTYAGLRWAEDGSKVYFGIKERTPAEDDEDEEDEEKDEGEDEEETSEDTTSEDEEDDEDDEDDEEDEEDLEPSTVQIWHARDVDIYPRQEVQQRIDRQKNYLVAWHLDSDRFVQLGTELTEDIRIVEGDRYAVGTDQTPYENDRMFGPVFRDIYLIDIATGEARPVKEKVQYNYGPSSGGRYILYLLDDHYWTYEIQSERHTNITENIVSTSFVDIKDDHTVDQKPPFGIVGWSENDRTVLVYDEYDVWEIRPDGSDATRLTNGVDERIRHRRMRLDFEEEFVDTSEPMYFSMYGERSKYYGYGRVRRGRFDRLIWEDANVGRLTKAEEADVFAYVVQDFDDSPDYFVSGPDLQNGRLISNTNPFHSDYLWGHSELIEYENTWGEELQGALYYPADYEPGKRYPMIVYIYEIRSPSVHTYTVPSTRSAYNTTVWTSQGYFVLQPDIVYRDRNPGLSAVEAIVPAVESVLATGKIDPDRVGLTGHSWGGYQTAFVVTQTDIFSAAVAGAPLTNLVSMYLSVYWNTGGTDARIFEISQGRMEVPFWEDVDAYVANSPVFHVENLNTPLLVAHGDEDGAVDFNQGVEYYNAARRANKDFVLLVYEGENHGNREKANQIDYHTRINEWFGHYLKGDDAPEWIAEGVSYLDQADAKEEKTEN